MDVDRDRSRHEAKIWSSKGTCDIARIPTVIKGAVGHRICVGEDRWRIIVHHWNPNLVKLCGHLREPFVPTCGTGASLVCAIDISTPPQSALLRCFGIDNHASHCRDSRRVEPANEQQRCILQIADRAETLEIRIRRRARNLTRIKSEHSQLRINRGFVAPCYRTRTWLISNVGGGRANLERDPFDYRQKMDGAGSNHWRFAGRLA